MVKVFYCATYIDKDPDVFKSTSHTLPLGRHARVLRDVDHHARALRDSSSNSSRDVKVFFKGTLTDFLHLASKLFLVLC